jgi:flavodoxin
MKTLLVYYSWTGNTRKLAQKITSKLKCDVEEIYEKHKRKGKLDYMVGGFQAMVGMKSGIEKPKKNPSDYDLVLLGGPVWAGRIAPALRAYLSQSKVIGNYAFFMSKGGGEHGKAVEGVETLTGKKPIAILAVKESELSEADISGFLQSLKAKSP